MSARDVRLVVAPKAQRDIRNIRLYGLRRWGEVQTATYLTALGDGFSRLQDHPFIGRSRDDLGLGLRSWKVERHVIFYRGSSTQIEIARILHERTDPAQHEIS